MRAVRRRRPRHGGGGRGPAGFLRGLRQLQLRLGARRGPGRREPGGGRRGAGGRQPGEPAAAAAARRAVPGGVAAARLPLQPAQQADRLGEPRPQGARGAPPGVQGVEEQRRAPAGGVQPAREEAPAATRRRHGHKVVQHL